MEYNKNFIKNFFEYIFLIFYFLSVAFILVTFREHLNLLIIKMSQFFNVEEKNIVAFFVIILLMIGIFIFTILRKLRTFFIKRMLRKLNWLALLMIGKMKNSFFIILTLSIFILFSSCDMHSGKRPRDYPSTLWVSEDPEMWFEIGIPDNSAYTPREKIFGSLILDGQNIEIEVFFNYGDGIYFNPISDNDTFTRGRCKFSPDKLIVNIDKERDSFLNRRWETITFIRVPEWVFQIVTDRKCNVGGDRHRIRLTR